MTTRYQLLLGLLSAPQQKALMAVRTSLIEDPTSLDVHNLHTPGTTLAPTEEVEDGN